MNITEEIRQILANPSTSGWLANSIQALLKRDIVDATNDAEFLADLMRRRYDAITHR